MLGKQPTLLVAYKAYDHAYCVPITAGICEPRNGARGQVHGSNPEPPMSALGQKQTFGKARLMSALPPKADIGTQSWNVRFSDERRIGPISAVTPMKVAQVRKRGEENSRSLTARCA